MKKWTYVFTLENNVHSSVFSILLQIPLSNQSPKKQTIHLEALPFPIIPNNLIFVVVWLLNHVQLFVTLMGHSPPDSSGSWNSLGKNTGAGCHSLLQRTFPIQGLNSHLLHCRWILYHWATRKVHPTHWKWKWSHSVVSDSLRPHGLYSPWNSPGQNTGVGSLSLLQGIFPTQGSNPGLPHCRWILYQLSYEGSPNIKSTPLIPQRCPTQVGHCSCLDLCIHHLSVG